MGDWRRLSRLSHWRSRPKGRSEAIGVADLRTQSPPLANTLDNIIGANDPKATATQSHAESVASFQFFRSSTLWPLVGQSPLPLAPTAERRAFLCLPTSPAV
jgi:hypothetical protein